MRANRVEVDGMVKGWQPCQATLVPDASAHLPLRGRADGRARDLGAQAGQRVRLEDDGVDWGEVRVDVSPGRYLQRTGARTVPARAPIGHGVVCLVVEEPVRAILVGEVV